MTTQKLNKSDHAIVAGYFLFSSAVIWLSFYVDHFSRKEYLAYFITYLIKSLSTTYIFILWLIPAYLIKKKNFLLFVLLGLLSLLVFGLFEFYTTMWYGGYSQKMLPSFGGILINCITDAEWDMAPPVGLILTKKHYENQLQMSNLLKGQKENELRLLREQINPHFLFNNLNTLDALVDISPKKAKKYIANLAAIYRYLIDANGKEVRTLKEELALAENYFYLVSTRFGSDYELEIIEDEKVKNKYLPTGAIQGLMENVIKHNKVVNGTSVKIEILIEKNDLVVKNNKTRNAQSYESLGTGLKNLNERYQLLFDEPIHVSENDNHFWVQIPIVDLVE